MVNLSTAIRASGAWLTRHWRQLVRAAGLAAALAGTAANAAAPPIVLPFQFEDGRVYVPVRIGASPSAWFILDTGAGTCGVDEALARSLGLASTAIDNVGGAGAGSSRASRIETLAVSVDSVPLTCKAVTVAPFDQLLATTGGRHVGGIVGGAFFREHVVALDFARRQLTLHAPASWHYSGPGVRVPFDLDTQLPMAWAALTLADGRQVAAHVVLDLGAKSTLLVPEHFARQHQLGEALGATVTTGLGAGMGGDTFYTFGRARRIGFGTGTKAGVDRPVVGLSSAGSLRSQWHDGLLGAPFLSEFHVIFDYARREMILEPAPPSGLAAAFDRSGLFLVAEGPALDAIMVRDVTAGSPASVAGVLARDRLLQVDGEPVERLGLPGTRERLRAPAGRRVQLALARDGNEVILDIELRDLI